MNMQNCVLIIKGRFSEGRDELRLPGNWQQVNHWKRLHKRWAIQTTLNGQTVTLAQSVAY